MLSTFVVAVCLFQNRGIVPSGDIALLEPIVLSSVFTGEGTKLDPYAAAQRVHRRIAGESRRWEGWHIRFKPERDTFRLQQQIFGTRGSYDSLADMQKLHFLSAKIDARYVAYYRLEAFKGDRTTGVSARTTGLATVDLYVYDSVAQKLIWQEKKTETSIRGGTKNEMQPRMDQAYLNALRKTLEPFATKGYIKNF